MKANLDTTLYVRTSTAITKKVNKLKHLRDQLKTLSAIEKGLVDDIKDYIGDSEVLQGVNSETLVTYLPYGSLRFDVKKFKGQNPDLYDEYAAHVVTRKFLLK